MSIEEMTNAITAMKVDVTIVKDDIAAGKVGMKAAIAASREETNATIAAVKYYVTSMKDDIAASREETNAAIAAVKDDITSVKENISAVDARVDEKILSVEENFQKQMTELRKE